METWQNQVSEVRNGIGIRLSAAVLASAPIAMAVFLACLYPEELRK